MSNHTDSNEQQGESHHLLIVRDHYHVDTLGHIAERRCSCSLDAPPHRYVCAVCVDTRSRASVAAPEGGAQVSLEAVSQIIETNCENYRVSHDARIAILNAVAAASSPSPASPALPSEPHEWVRYHARSNACGALVRQGTKETGYCLQLLGHVVHAAPAPVQPEGEQSFQNRVQPWMLACFGAEIASDKEERNHRFLEEALELVQTCGATRSEAHQLVDYTFDRPVGAALQEVGGVMVTLAALCLAQGFDMHECGETELTRIWGKVETIRAKQAAKPKHSPLPEHVAATPPDTPVVAARAAAEEIAAIEQPRHTNTFIPPDDCDICTAYKTRIAAIITRHFAVLVDREQAAKTAFDTVKAALESENHYSILQVAAMTAAKVRAIPVATTSPSEDYPYPPCAVCGHFGMVVPVWVCTYHDLSRIAATSPSETAVGGEARKCLKCGHDAFDGLKCIAESDSPSFQARWVSCGCVCEFAAPVPDAGDDEDRYRSGVEDTCMAICSCCADVTKWGEATRVEGSTRYWHTKYDPQYPCEATAIRVILAAALRSGKES